MDSLLSYISDSNRVTVFTDLEPDDILAIDLLESYSKRHPLEITYVVGEGDAKTKSDRLNAHLSGARRVLIGHDSERKYEYDGYELIPQSEFMAMLEKDKHLIPREHYVEEWYPKEQPLQPLKAPEQYKYTKDGSLYIILKPPRELMQGWKNGSIDLSSTKAVIYGSFNLRCMMRRYTQGEVSKFLKSFLCCYVYETFYVTNNNSFYDREVCSKYSHTLKRCIYLWNKSIYYDCVMSVQGGDVDTSGLSNSGRECATRNHKVLNSIDKQFMQVVNADSGLMGSLISHRRDELPLRDVDISFNEFGYTQYVERPGSSIKMFVLNKQSDEEKKFKALQVESFNLYL